MVILKKLYLFLGSFVNFILPVPCSFWHLQGVEWGWDGGLWGRARPFLNKGATPPWARACGRSLAFRMGKAGQSSLLSPKGVSQRGGASIPNICCLPVLLEKENGCVHSCLRNFNPSWPSLANWTLEWAQTSDVISVSPTRRSHFCLHLLISFLGSPRFLPDSINLSKRGKKGSRPRGWDGLKRRKSGNVTKFRARG